MLFLLLSVAFIKVGLIHHHFTFVSSVLELQSLDLEEEKPDEDSTREVEDAPVFETPVPKVSTSDSPDNVGEKHETQWRGFLRKLKKGPAMHFHPNIPSLPSIKKISRKKSRNAAQSMPALPPALDTDLTHCFESSWKNFSLSDLKSATNNFSHGI